MACRDLYGTDGDCCFLHRHQEKKKGIKNLFLKWKGAGSPKSKGVHGSIVEINLTFVVLQFTRAPQIDYTHTKKVKKEKENTE